MKHKTLALSLSLSMLFALASCGGPDPGGSSNPSASQTPSESQNPSGSQSPEPSVSEPAQADSVDLQAFYEDLLTKYESAGFSPTMQVEGEFLTSFYPELDQLSLKQQVIYQPMQSGVPCEIALVETENADDVQKVKDIFQARIDYQVGTDDNPGAAWYPESIESWKNNSRIASNGSCVMLVVWEDSDQFVEDFNALF